MGDQIPFLFSTEHSRTPTPRVPLASPVPLPRATWLAFRECSWLCSTDIISFAGDITNPNLSALRLLRNRRLVETRCPLLSHRLHRAFCMFLAQIGDLHGLAKTHSSG